VRLSGVFDPIVRMGFGAAEVTKQIIPKKIRESLNRKAYWVMSIQIEAYCRRDVCQK